MGRKRKRTIEVKSRVEYSVEDEGYRDGYSDGIRRLTQRKPGWFWGLMDNPTLSRRLRKARWEAYNRGYDDGAEQARDGQVIIVDKGKEGTGAV